jgi:ABC-2 type transport system ATP-binding protein
MEATVEISEVRKRFGQTVALDGISFTVTPGNVTGFVGPNGAGKSTTMRVILGLEAADHGSALIGGRPLGMRQRLGLAAAMLGDPAVLILDEPFNGMDPEGIVWMRGFLRSLAAEGRAVLVSSHLMSELQDSASRLVVIGRGKLIADTSVAELITAASAGRVTLRTSARSAAMTALSTAGATVAATGPDTLTICELDSERIVEVLGQNEVPFAEVAVHHSTLEEAYMELTRNAVEFTATETDASAGHRVVSR